MLQAASLYGHVATDLRAEYVMDYNCCCEPAATNCSFNRPHMMGTLAVFWLLPGILASSAFACVLKLAHINLTPQQYNGSWFRIAHLGPQVDYLPQNATAALLKLTPNGENLDMVEFYESDGICYGPIYGSWIKQVNGYVKRVQVNNTVFKMAVKAIFHEYSGDDNEEMNMVLYGCRRLERDGKCEHGEEMASILSNSRHPQTLALFKSAKHLEDNICIDILQLKTLNTYSSCGDEIVDDDQKLLNAQVDSEGELIESECKVQNFPKRNIANFFDEPRMLTVIAFMDPVLINEDISHISCLFTSQYEAACNDIYLRHKTCYKSTLKQSFLDSSTIESSTVLQLKNGSSVVIDWSGTLLWQNGDEYIIYKCIDINEDGTCDQYRIYVWSDEDLMDQPTMRTIYDELDAICSDPTNLIFLNTFHECDESKVMKEPSVECGLMPGWSPISVQLLEGVWFFAADINADPKIYIQSAVVELTASGARESDSRCIGPGKGTVELLRNNSTILVQIQYHDESLAELQNNHIKWENQILYVDNQRMLLYWCFKRAVNGSCVQYDVDILVRTRHLAYHDLAILEPYLKMACVSHDQLRWFDLQSRCGLDMSQTTKLRRTIMTLSHREVLDILTNVQEPRCKKDELKGLGVDLSAIEKAGKWLLISRYDRFEFITYAMIGRIRVVAPGKAIVKVFQSAARPGLQKNCHQRMFMLVEHTDGDDVTYRLYFESLLGSKTFMILRFLFMNRHVGVIHSCLSYNKTGECIESLLYVVSRHDSIDHTELSVLETVANSVCLPAEHLVHVALHDDCIHENHNFKLATLACSTVSTLPAPPPADQILEQLEHRFKNNTYFAIASSLPKQGRFVLKFNNGFAKKVYESDYGCHEREIRVYAVRSNDMLVVVNDNELVLLSAFALSSPLAIQSAQYSGEFPCLLPIQYGIRNGTSTTTTIKHRCEALTLLPCAPKPVQLQASKDGFMCAVNFNGKTLQSSILRGAISDTVGPHQSAIRPSGESLAEKSGSDLATSAVFSTSGECLRKEIWEINVQENGAYQLRIEDGVPLHINSEVASTGTIAMLDERFAVLYSNCDTDCIGVAGERRATVWTRVGLEVDDSVRNLLETLCILEDELDNKTGESNCW
ncbi:unnamed protein product [Toxocara canis]|uniref:Uncharacterized protein n=1 Tax=Toxocara canis TaxID=6265 RepID=A0A3P7I602_TOXCA|nr:unnamed protein product [Toxocara canis]